MQQYISVDELNRMENIAELIHIASGIFLDVCPSQKTLHVILSSMCNRKCSLQYTNIQIKPMRIGISPFFVKSAIKLLKKVIIKKRDEHKNKIIKIKKAKL